MARTRMRSQTEWLVKLYDAGGADVHSLVVYRLLTANDPETRQITLRKLWVVTRGYSGGGIYGSYSAVMYPEGEQHRLVGCHYAYPDRSDFHEAELDFVTQKDCDVIQSLWQKADRMTTFELAEDFGDASTFTLNMELPEESKSECSFEWDGYLLVNVCKHWRMFLYFADDRSPRDKKLDPVVPLCPRPDGVDADD